MAGRKQMHSEDWWATQKPAHILRCTAHLRSDGSQCRNEAAPGTNVCNKHGALAPVVQAAAARRIQMSVEDAVKRLHQMLDDGNVEARDKIKILHDLLDRGGLAPTSRVLVGVVAEDPVERLFQTLLADPSNFADPTLVQRVPSPEIAAWNRGADPQELADDDDVVEGEVVEEPEPDAHTVRVTESMSSRPPAHIRKALEELL